MFESLKIGHQISMTEEDTVANALSGGIGATNTHTLSLVGEVVDEHVLVDEVDEHGAIARSKADAPEIDGLVHIPDGRDLSPGMLVEVEIESSDDYDLTARFPF